MMCGGVLGASCLYWGRMSDPSWRAFSLRANRNKHLENRIIYKVWAVILPLAAVKIWGCQVKCHETISISCLWIALLLKGAIPAFRLTNATTIQHTVKEQLHHHPSSLCDLQRFPEVTGKLKKCWNICFCYNDLLSTCLFHFYFSY